MRGLDRAGEVRGEEVRDGGGEAGEGGWEKVEVGRGEKKVERCGDEEVWELGKGPVREEADVPEEEEETGGGDERAG